MPCKEDPNQYVSGLVVINFLQNFDLVKIIFFLEAAS